MSTVQRIVLGSVLLFAQSALAAQGEILARPRTTVPGINYGYWEYLPQDYDDNSEASYPLVVFLGGQGQEGDGMASAAGLEKGRLTPSSNSPRAAIASTRTAST